MHVVTYYITADDVASFLMLRTDDGTGDTQRLTFSSTSDPTQAEVEAIINEVEDYVDSYTKTAWRERTVVNETHDFPLPRYRSPLSVLRSAVFLRHYPVRQFSSVSGDKLEVWNGKSWDDLLVTGTEGQGPTDGDFHVDYDRGIIYFRGFLHYYAERSIRVTYRYGFSTVPSDIKLACKMLVAARLVENFGYTLVIPSADIQPRDLEGRVERWEKQALAILDRRVGVRMVMPARI